MGQHKMFARLDKLQGRSYVLALHRPRIYHHASHPELWNAYFSQKSRCMQRAIMHDGNLLVAMVNLCAMSIQRHVRGHLSRVLIVVALANDAVSAARIPEVSRQAAASATKARERAKMARSTRAANNDTNIEGDLNSPRFGASEIGLIARFLEAKITYGSRMADELSYNEFAATFLQSFFRGRPWRRMLVAYRSIKLQSAAISIQRSWRIGAPAVQSRPPTATLSGRAVLSIQNAWRSYANRQIYNYFRDMIRFREQGDPATMLRGINPREAGMFDPALKLHVRFRLGGYVFPPSVYYKVRHALIDAIKGRAFKLHSHLH
eukprot:6003108-Pleurochrysis_carterae.AAC.1